MLIFGEPGLEKSNLAALVHFGSPSHAAPLVQVLRPPTLPYPSPDGAVRLVPATLVAAHGDMLQGCDRAGKALHPTVHAV